MTNNGSPLLKLPNTYRAFYSAFTQLTGLQYEAIAPILGGQDLIVQAATGTGKTEAVFAPAIESLMVAKEKKTLLYLVPTRALAMDMERRLSPIVVDKLGLSLGVRTGDVKRLGGQQTDLLITTPESLDVALGSTHADLKRFIGRVRTVIIDEAHQLVDSCRGEQLAYLLQRLQCRMAARLQKIALSATLADADRLIQTFSFSPHTRRLKGTVSRHIMPHLVYLKNDTTELTALVHDLFETWKYRKLLIFSNNRGRCDQLFALFNESGPFKGVTELHYSNLKAKQRKAAEGRFRKARQALCIATSTLELGIDVGDIDGVVLFEPPDSVTAFLQRIGRSNRRGGLIHFWGIACGALAGEQVLRFMALLTLARQGRVEQNVARHFPSVLVQQILSCLYEKKCLSLAALERLFPQQKDALSTIFPLMIQQKWLKASATIKGLFHGGWRYGEALVNLKIWGNFPETEEDYALIVGHDALADIPATVVKQLTVGDRVQLAGKRLKICAIEAQGQRALHVQPCTVLDDKDIFWVGGGLRVPFEVAQEVKALLEAPQKAEDDALEQEQQSAQEQYAALDLTDFGLFNRARQLFSQEQKKYRSAVTLANGISVGRNDNNGLYRYWTFLGAAWNLILQWRVEACLAPNIDDLMVTSDAMGLECSHRIDFQALRLPTSREALSAFVKHHLKALCPLFPLNRYTAVLSSELLVEEISGQLYDPRMTAIFAAYGRVKSIIIRGDVEFFNQFHEDGEGIEKDNRRVLWIKVKAASLRSEEKQRWLSSAKQSSTDAYFPINSPLQTKPRALTGTLIGNYMRYQQCHRWLVLQFLSNQARPYVSSERQHDVRLRMEKGRCFEADVLQRLQADGINISFIKETAVNGTRLSLQERADASHLRLLELIEKSQQQPQHVFLLCQAVLLVPKLSPMQKSSASKHSPLIEEGCGIVDIIRISSKHGPTRLDVGDIKYSLVPSYSQKWQVAFYHYLLQQRLVAMPFLGSVQLSTTGFLVTRPALGGCEPVEHAFDLTSFIAAFPSLLKKMTATFEATASSLEHYRIRSVCVGCDYFEPCYVQTLNKQDIGLLPRLSDGLWQRFQSLGIERLEDAQNYFSARAAASAAANENNECKDWGAAVAHPLNSDNSETFNWGQRNAVIDTLQGIKSNTLCWLEPNEAYFPATPCVSLFVHAIVDSLTGHVRSVAWGLVDEKGAQQAEFLRVLVAEKTLLEVRKQAFNTFQTALEARGMMQKPLFVFCFGKASHAFLMAAEGREGLSNIKALVDLKNTLSMQAHFPLHGVLSLSVVARLLGIHSCLLSPESLFHGDACISPINTEATGFDAEILEKAQLQAALKVLIGIKAWLDDNRLAYLPLEATQCGEASADESPLLRAYLHFLAEEQRLKAADILDLQCRSLAERVALFRAVGPLIFSSALLDDEGFFLHGFRFNAAQVTAKFREGDWLRLSPVGAEDIQAGSAVILADYRPWQGRLWVRALKGRLVFNKALPYSLEEDLSDRNAMRLNHALRHALAPIDGHAAGRVCFQESPQAQPKAYADWVNTWINTRPEMALNSRQQAALRLPFHYKTALIEGPPGTGKTYLLAWTLIALMAQAQQHGRSLRIVISALTHKAIEQALQKVVTLVKQYALNDFPPCFKWGRMEGQTTDFEASTLQPLQDRETLNQHPSFILGATGFGLYQLFDGKKGQFPAFFDWVVFDEASQMLLPQALLTLLYGKGNYLFYGDVKQLPPIVLGHYDNQEGFSVEQSILALLRHKYSEEYRVCLDVSYRMNDVICAFPSATWYGGRLHPAPDNAKNRLRLNGTPDKGQLGQWLNPQQPVTLLLLDHQGCGEIADQEVEIVTQLACCLMREHGLKAEQLALISPHRAQNNATAKRLRQRLGDDQRKTLPLIDTVERIQGAEREVIIFSLSCSDLDRIESPFINNANRFNVALTRAQKKVIVIASDAFFAMVPRSETSLNANRCFKDFLDFCDKKKSLYRLVEESLQT